MSSHINQHNVHPARQAAVTRGALYLVLAVGTAVLLLLLLLAGPSVSADAGLRLLAVLMVGLMGLLGWRGAEAFLSIPNNSTPPEKAIGLVFSVAIMLGALVLAVLLLVRTLA